MHFWGFKWHLTSTLCKSKWAKYDCWGSSVVTHRSRSKKYLCVCCILFLFVILSESAHVKSSSKKLHSSLQCDKWRCLWNWVHVVETFSKEKVCKSYVSVVPLCIKEEVNKMIKVNRCVEEGEKCTIMLLIRVYTWGRHKRVAEMKRFITTCRILQ